MKKTYSFTLLLLLACFAQLVSQTVVTIPVSNTASAGANVNIHRKPLGTSRAYERSAMKYTQAEIGIIGTITNIAFYCDTIFNPGKAAVKIYMKEVADSTFTASTVTAEETGATLVYQDSIVASSFIQNSWVNLLLTTPFVHNNSNVEVIVETNTGGTTGTDLTTLSKGFRYFTFANNRMQYWQSPNNNGTIPAGPGTLSASRTNVQFTITPLPACSAPPLAGYVIAASSSICAGSAASLSLQSNSTGLGMTYQWYSSTDSINWTIENGAMQSSYTPIVNSATYYTCVLTCSGSSDTAAGVGITIKPFFQCYCTAGLGGNCVANAIDSVAITGSTLANGSTGCSAGNQITYPATGATTATLTQGQTYTIVTKYLGNERASVWIDYNHNSVFDTYEWKQLCTTSTAGTAVFTTFTVPINALTGHTIMRIRSRGNVGQNDSTSACANFNNGETENYIIDIVAALPCVSPPTAGAVVASATSVCNGTIVNLSLAGSSNGLGLTYQWYSSADGNSWSILPGETLTTYSTSVSSSSYFTCVLTCSGFSDTATMVHLVLNPFYYCYCTAGIGGGCATTAIDSVGIISTTLANGLTGCSAGNYSSYPSLGATTATLVQGQTYTFVTKYTGNVKSSVWIDYNHNGVFDNNEWTQLCTTSTAGTLVNSTVTLPIATLTGNTGMRIRTRNSASVNDSTSACAAFGSGETEDYIITIIAATNCTTPPSAGIAVASASGICSGFTASLSLSGGSTGLGLSYQWLSSFNGGINWIVETSATQTTYHPIINNSAMYTCVVTCSGVSDTATGVNITLNPFYVCYCSFGLGGNCTANAIDSVAITGTTLSNGLTGCSPGNHTIYPAAGNTTATLMQGQVYNLVTKYIGNEKASVWIDYNGDGTYQTSEWKQLCTTSNAGTTFTTSITIPLTATPGLTGMRIRSRNSAAQNDSSSSCTTFNVGEIEDYVLNIVAATFCTAPPVAGTTIASTQTVCPGSTVNFSLTGNDIGLGMTYQWVTSTDGSLFTPIVGDTLSYCTVAIMSEGYYACQLTCSGQPQMSVPVHIYLNPFYNCYCNSGLGGNCATSAIDSVAFATTTLINGHTGCSAGNHIIYPALGNTTGTFILGQTYTLTTRFNGNVKASMWIDYDQSGTYDTAEWNQICLTSVAGADAAITFTIPATATEGITGLRIRSRNAAGQNDSSSACAAFGSGETEDYLITIASTTTGIATNSFADGLTVNPNPTSGIFKLTTITNYMNRVKIYNVLGECVYQSTIHNQQTVIDISGNPKGIYVVQIMDDNKNISTKKIVLQ